MLLQLGLGGQMNSASASSTISSLEAELQSSLPTSLSMGLDGQNQLLGSQSASSPGLTAGLVNTTPSMSTAGQSASTASITVKQVPLESLLCS